MLGSICLWVWSANEHYQHPRMRRVKVVPTPIPLLELSLALLAATPPAHPQIPPKIDVQLSSGYVRLNIAGAAGTLCTIQSVTNLPGNWQFVTNFTLFNSPFLIVDPTGP